MSSFVKCDNCERTTDIVDDAFNPWYILSLAPVHDRHFHSLECLREWLSPEACAARIAERDGA